jgi:probable HAF family extracellular repeat protein
MWSVILMLATATNQAFADFISLGDLPGGQSYSVALGVSADGHVVVGQSSSALGFEAFRWTQVDGMRSLGASPNSAAAAASAGGSVVVGRLQDLQAFRWTQTTGPVGLGSLPGGNQSEALGVSADGAVVVGQGNGVIGGVGSGNLAFRWTEQSGMVFLGDLPGGPVTSIANGVSADGSVIVGGSNSVLGQEAFRWTQTQGMVRLGDLPGGGFLSFARAISPDGGVIVGNANSAFGNEGFRWTQESGMIGLGDLPGGGLFFNSYALGVSENGSIVVGIGETDLASEAFEAFVWDSMNGIRNLKNVLISQGDDLTGWRLDRANGISADGTIIVGSGINPAGQPEAWLARLGPVTPIPEPSTILLLGSGVIGMLVWIRVIVLRVVHPLAHRVGRPSPLMGA